MRAHYYKQIAVVLIVICFLGTTGLASAHSVVHESHHAHHDQTAHGTVLCSWMCAAGQVLEEVAVPALVELAPIDLVDIESFRSLPLIAPETAASRGPPLHIQA